jgi:hypothetical protein
VTRRRRARRAPSSIDLDLIDFDERLRKVLPQLLLGRFEATVLVRWAKARYWVSSAQEGDLVADRGDMEMAVDYLYRVARERPR